MGSFWPRKERCYLICHKLEESSIATAKVLPKNQYAILILLSPDNPISVLDAGYSNFLK